MVPNLLSPHPFNAPLLPLLRFRASSLSSPRREIGLMKLKGMGLSQHCGFQWHCLILPPLLSATPARPPPPPLPPSHTPTPCTLALRWQFITHPTKDPYLTHYISAYYWPFQSAGSQANAGGKKSGGLIGLGARRLWGTWNYQSKPGLIWIRYQMGKRQGSESR